MRPAHCAQVKARHATDRSGFQHAATTVAKCEEPSGSQLLSRGQSVFLVLPVSHSAALGLCARCASAAAGHRVPGLKAEARRSKCYRQQAELATAQVSLTSKETVLDTSEASGAARRTCFSDGSRSRRATSRWAANEDGSVAS